MEILDFRPGYAADFARLNLEWLEKYFSVEPIDREILDDPQAEIIDHGGQILFAAVDGAIVGTVALKHHGAGRYELTKMAVTDAAQGQGIGKALLVAAIAQFRAIDGDNLFLESHSSLETAIHLYQSAGFRHADRLASSDYQRSDTYMVYFPEHNQLN